MNGVENIPFEEYLARDAVSCSDLKAFAKSPEHYILSKLFPSEPTFSMNYGTAFHKMVEGDDLSVTYYDGVRRGKGWEAHKEKNKDKTFVTKSEYEELKERVEKLRTCPTTRELLSGVTIWEGSVFAHDAVLDVPIKCRFDGYNPNFRGVPTLIDLKTAQDGSPRGFTSAVYRFKYHWQAAWYMRLLQKAHIPVEQFVFVVSETDGRKSFPRRFTLPALYKMSNAMLEEALVEIGATLGNLARCRKSNFYPGYTNGEIMTLEGYAPRTSKEDTESVA